jgi:predicted branched-subunit amino acid permease
MSPPRWPWSAASTADRRDSRVEVRPARARLMPGAKTSPWASGMRRVLPVLPGLVPFGALAGAAAVDNGLSVLQACAASAFLYAGTAQIAAFEVIGDGLAPALGAVLLVNLRFAALSASLAPHLTGLSLGRRPQAPTS